MNNFRTKLGLVLAILVPTSAFAQTTVVVPAEDQPPPPPAVVVVPADNPPPPPSVVVVPTPTQAATLTETDSGPDVTLLTTGLVSFGISYGAAVIVASQSDHKGDDRLYVPIVGPWLDLADRGGCSNLSNSSCDNETTNKVLIIIDGVVQGAGALAVVGGILSAGSHTTRTTTVSDAGKVHFVPVSYGPATPGLAAFGSW